MCVEMDLSDRDPIPRSASEEPSNSNDLPPKLPQNASTYPKVNDQPVNRFSGRQRPLMFEHSVGSTLLSFGFKCVGKKQTVEVSTDWVGLSPQQSEKGPEPKTIVARGHGDLR